MRLIQSTPSTKLFLKYNQDTYKSKTLTAPEGGFGVANVFLSLAGTLLDLQEKICIYIGGVRD